MLTEKKRAARQIINGERPKAERVDELAKALKTEPGGFYWVRRLLELVLVGSAAPDYPELATTKNWQQFALATYKDDGLPRLEAFDRALAILRHQLDLERTEDPETLGIAGALFKRWWLHTQEVPKLRTALGYYLRGHQITVAPDGSPNDGYCGINAAYVADELAAIDGTPDGLKQPDTVRRQVIEMVDPLVAPGEPGADYYFLWATLGEAHLALGEFRSAQGALERARGLGDDWEVETTAIQLGGLLRARGMAIDTSDNAGVTARNAIAALIGNADAVVDAIAGKIGLALSGGGFRAALFHIGVLGRLAEAGLLRHIEVLSCVSGGSIVGAHYYLELQHLLETKLDEDINTEDYVRIVKRIADDFVAGVQTDLRNRIYASPAHNARLASLGHSATIRLGELYEEALYARIPDGRGTQPRMLDHLLIIPHGTPENRGFHPGLDNATRRNKVPVIYFNTVTLNTGHTWQYTASWQGEPPAGVDTNVDANERLRRLYHEQLPEGAPPARLGTAVAASSCVPGLFPPIELIGLYEDREIGLVDGGVRDNQGIGALFDNDCQIVIVSDASGQLPNVPITQRSRLGVPLRSSSVMGHSLRGAQYREVEARAANGLLHNSMWVHLKSGLTGDPVNWIDMPEPDDQTTGGVTPHGIATSVQRRLADLRTDLDAFTDNEAYCLMCAGYATIDHALTDQRWVELLGACQQTKTDWSFLALKKAISDAPEHAARQREIERQLDIGAQLFGKAGKLVRGLRIAGITLGLGLVALLVWLGLWAAQTGVLSSGILLVLLALLVLVFIAGRFISLHWLRRYTIAAAMTSIGWIPFRLYLSVALPRLLKAGKHEPTR